MQYTLYNTNAFVVISKYFTKALTFFTIYAIFIPIGGAIFMKKLFTTMLLATVYSLSSMMSFGTYASTQRIRGDINQDGKVSSADVLIMKKCLLGTSEQYDPDTILEADANGDGKFSSADLLATKKVLLGIKDIEYVEDSTSQLSKETETYSSSYLTMTIPKGWIVEEGGVGMDHTLIAHSKDNPQYQIFVRLKAEPILKSKEAKEYWQFYNSMSADVYSMFANAPYVEEATMSNFYANFNDFGTWAKSETTYLSNAYMPTINNFDVVSTVQVQAPSYYGSNVKDSSDLVATFTDADGNTCKGAFSGILVNFGDTVNDMTFVNQLFGTNFPSQLDTSYYMAYSLAFVTTPEDQFSTDAELLTKCLNSIQYDGEFIKSTNQSIQDRNDYFVDIWNS